MTEKIMEWDNPYQGHHQAYLYYNYQYKRLNGISQHKPDIAYNNNILYYYNKGNRPVRIDDESGIQQFEYGNMREITKQSHIFTLPYIQHYEDELFFYHGDHLSSTQMITDLYGNVVQQVHYAPFGEVIIEYNAYWHQGKVPDYKFNAKELDEENGMYYYSARYYNPPTFISRDPLFEKYFWMSPYAYCMNNPLIFIDPTGEDVEIVCPVTNQKVLYTPSMAIPDGSSDFVSNAITSLNAMNSTKNGNIVLGDLV
ncbi:MAG: RHS repeat-associated core domain-containing protein, partial [Bacteroidales bacterium]|nr:RHS repeat-associated core domain-containing protein [Bacteroidales bacterium]